MEKKVQSLNFVSTAISCETLFPDLITLSLNHWEKNSWIFWRKKNMHRRLRNVSQMWWLGQKVSPRGVRNAKIIFISQILKSTFFGCTWCFFDARIFIGCTWCFLTHPLFQSHQFPPYPPRCMLVEAIQGPGTWTQPGVGYSVNIRGNKERHGRDEPKFKRGPLSNLE